ncbi:hypothetical protein AVEN_94349-1 [Araneus ventricosus]|uniref:Uncharacterized protein n=1 Tax=Araneus ventricosus TaxID=182803 RepID=A0A4Y2E9N4_ARAVE|nr:hypothetical protein AVEN_94349-1 [Araneus ventricosus]
MKGNISQPVFPSSNFRAIPTGDSLNLDVKVNLHQDRIQGKYCSATDSETITFGRFYTGKGCQVISHMSALPGFFVRSRSVKCKHHPSILHFPPILMKITPPGACAKVQRVSESVAKQHLVSNPEPSGHEVETLSPGHSDFSPPERSVKSIY